MEEKEIKEEKNILKQNDKLSIDNIEMLEKPANKMAEIIAL